LPLVIPGGLIPLELPDADAASPDRRVRACDRLTEEIATHKVRIRNLALQLLPTFPTVITNKLDLPTSPSWSATPTSEPSSRPERTSSPSFVQVS
jgi:hypothetical protein